jgi:murein DD-endopeptidase MepM/ murein hydrolase activator NlpD
MSRRTARFLISLLMALGSANVAAALELKGERVQGGLLFGRTEPGTPVALNGRSVRVSEAGDFVIGFDRDARRKHVLAVGKETVALDIAPRKFAVQRITGIAQNIMNPSAEDLKRIRREQALVSAARRRDDPRRDFADGFVWPITGPISGVFGSQRVYNGVPSRPHYGVDVAAPTGSNVHAPAPGIVTLAEPDLFFSGGTVIIDHGHHLSSSFLHMSKVSVTVGQRVERGTLIGKVGATGRVTGPHLDWRMKWREANVDPQLLVAPMPTAAPVSTARGDGK